MVRVTEVDMTYRQESGELQALQRVDLHVPAGESCAMIGPSGCGKTSLLFLLAGLLNAGTRFDQH